MVPAWWWSELKEFSVDTDEQLQTMVHGQSRVHASTHTRKLQPVEVLAALHGIALPQECELPASYTLRKWLTRRLATLNGKHKKVWQSIKTCPQKMEAHREATRVRMQKLRQRQLSLEGKPKAQGVPYIDYQQSPESSCCDHLHPRYDNLMRVQCTVLSTKNG